MGEPAREPPSDARAAPLDHRLEAFALEEEMKDEPWIEDENHLTPSELVSRVRQMLAEKEAEK